MYKKKLIIFGGQGFIGINISKYFLKHAKYKLISVGHKSKNKNKFFSKNEKKKIIFFENDIFDLNKIKNLDLKDSFVIFAAISGKLPYGKFSKKIFKLINFLKNKKINKFILLSSVSVYGNYSKKINESTKTKTLNNYAKNCLAAEKICFNAFNKTKINIIVLRIAQAFGQFKIKYGIVEKILKYYLKNQKYIFNNESLIRSYISVAKVAKILHLLIKKKTSNDLLNISNPYYIFSFKDLINKIEKILGFNKNIILAKQPFIIKNSICDSRKLQKKYGIKFKNHFGYEIKQVIRYFKKNEWS